MNEASASAAHPGEPAAGAVVVARGVRHVYSRGKTSTTALEGVDLSIGTGLHGLLGPNGAGKSTLMRILCALLSPTAGQVSVCGFDTVRQPRQVRARLGYLPQEFGAWRLQRVEEALDTLALLSGVTDRARRQRRVAEVLEQVGLSEVAERKVKKLSGGMVRRLGVAQALVHEPQVLVVDEPTVGLDPQERIRFRRLMADLAQDRTILLSTHIVADLGSGCRQLALLDGGRLVFQGPPAELLGRAAGRVFQTTVAVGGEDSLGPEVEIVSRTRDGVGVRLRGVTAGSLPPGAEVVTNPTLEEAYLAFMAERGRAAAARSEDGEREAERDAEMALDAPEEAGR